MRWIDSLEARFGRFAIPGLVRIIVAFNALVFVLYLLDKHFLELIHLDKNLILQGQVWRLVSYIFIPSLGRWWVMPDYLWLVFWLLFILMLGDGLEQAWGAFKLNVFYLVGMLGTTVAAFIFGASYNNAMLNLSLLFAFATLYPEHPILIFFVIPVQIKWIAWLSFAGLAFAFLAGSLATRMAIAASLANYVLFFWPMIFGLVRHRRQVTKRRQEFQLKSTPDTESLHRCATCGRTEDSDPDLEFRVSRDGEEYCSEHLPSRTEVPQSQP